MLAGRFLDAQLCCRQALAIDADHADSLHLMGLLSFQTEQYDHAAEWIGRAVRQVPKPEYLSNLGIALRRLQRYEEALKAFDKAIQLKADDAELWVRRSNVLLDLKRPTEALPGFRQVLELNPHHVEAAYRCGHLLHELARPEEALPYLDLGHQLEPNQAVILERRALVLHSLRRFEEALADNMRAHALNPDNPDTANNIGSTLQFLGRDDEALRWFDQALKLLPRHTSIFNNKATSLQRLHRFDEAAAICRHVKTIDPENTEADWNLSLLHLLTGNFADGWRGREIRWKIPSLSANYPKFSQPMWLGEDGVAGKTILIHVDEGLGDSIQFARYLPMLAARGATVILVEADALCPLLSHVAGVAACFPVSASAALPAFDMHCPMTSLPLAFGTRLDTIPSASAYLPAPPAERVRAWEQRLGPHDKLRVGLVWSGNPSHGNDHNRSASLRTLSLILDVDATFVSLQKDPRPGDAALLRERTDIIDLTAHLTDLGETAALVSCLDLVVTVDTSVAHLSAALGRPTWILLPHTPDYRWLLDRDDSPWYPTVKLFRQSETREYDSVFDRVRSELATLVAAWQQDRRDSWNAAQQSGAQLYQSGRLDEALVHLKPCLEQRPDHTPTLVMVTDCLLALRRFEEVVAVNRRAHVAHPGDAEPCNSVGVALQLLGRQQEALPWFDRAIGIRPDFIDALNNKAVALSDIHRFQEACATYDRVRTIEPDNIAAEWNLALLQMLTGDFEAGWIGREAQWRKPGARIYPAFSAPRWRGEGNIKDKTILICADEGLGDTIQFARYVPMVAARGARVVLAVEGPARALLSELAGRLGVSAEIRRHISGVRYALPDVRPAARLRHAARYDSVRDVVSACAAAKPRAGLGRSVSAPTTDCGSAWSGPAIPNTATIITGRSAADAVTYPGRRCDFCKSAERPESRR